MFNFLSEKFGGILEWVKGKGTISEADLSKALEQIKNAFLDADVPLLIVENFCTSVADELKNAALDKRLNPGQQVIKVVHEKLLQFLGHKEPLAQTHFLIPSVVMVLGLQGSGKTTTLAKLAHATLKEAAQKGKQRRILLASVDFYRPAAIEQLKILASQIKADFYAATSQNPVTAAQEIMQYAQKNRYEIVFFDTAGRLHVDTTLLEELSKIEKIVQPKHKFLVLDAMTGQESLKVAEAFNHAVNFHAAILTKMDGSCRGGAAFAFRYVLKKPIAYVGIGEKIDDLEAFIPERIASRILGMGDILTLIEKATSIEEPIKQENLAKKLMSGNFTLDDFAEQMRMMSNLGPLSKIASYLPGMGKLTPEMIEKSQKELKVFGAIMNSMTKKERLFPNCLDSSRKLRIAKGSGTSTQNINQLLEKFEQSKQFAKMLKNSGGFKNFLKR